MVEVIKEYFRQRALDPRESPFVCWHVALINVIGDHAAWEMADKIVSTH